jgi:hypothetical protein
MVALSWYKQRRYLGYRGDHLLFENMSNKEYRHHAYRNYIEYMHGYLGRGRRKVIPACVVSFIRRKWPDPLGQYTGYKDFREEDEDQDEPAAQPDQDELQILMSDY